MKGLGGADGRMDAKAGAVSARLPYVMGVAVFMQTADMTMIAPALPRIAAHFGIDTVTATMAMTAYLVGLALLAPAGGWLADRFGGRNVYRSAMALQAVALVCCALAPSFAWLVAGRFLSGLACSPMLSVSRLMVVRGAPPGERVATIATFSAFGLLGPLLAAPVGGLLVDWFDWQAVFVALLPVGAAVATAITLWTRDDGQRHAVPLDFVGLLLSAIALGAAVGAIEVLGHGRSAGLAGALGAVAGASFALLARHAGRARHPLVRFDLLRRKVFRLSLLADIPTRMLLTSCAMLVSLQQQVGLGRTASMAGALLLLPGFGQLVVKQAIPLSARLVGVRRAMIGWSAINAGAFALVGLLPGAAVPVIMALLAVHGLGRSIVLNLGTVLNFTDVRDEEMGAVTSLTAMAQQLSLVLGVGLSSLLLRIYAGDQPLGLEAIDSAMLTMAAVAMGGLLASLALPADAGQPRRAD